MTKMRTIIDAAQAIGAVIVSRNSAVTTYSDYQTLEFRGRQIEIRGSDHCNFPNPTTSKTCHEAFQLRSTARGFERALALWLGYSEDQLRGLNLNTQRDLKRLVALEPAC